MRRSGRDHGHRRRSAIAAALFLAVSAAASASPGALTVGHARLARCGISGAYCGVLARPLDPTGGVAGAIDIHFEYYPPRVRGPIRGTLVATEGGPGFPATESRGDYLTLFGPLRADHAVVLMDNRGTGRSAPVDCPQLQSEPVSVAGIAACGALLGDRAPLYSTAYATDDLEAVLEILAAGRVDLYGDSYGTFFAQVFAVRHPGRLRSLLLDGAYPLTGTDPGWYPHYATAMRDKFNLACARNAGCARVPGSSISRLTAAIDHLRLHPFPATGRDIDGNRTPVMVDPATLAVVLCGAPPLATLRDADAAARAYLSGDEVPLVRLIAESLASVDSRDPTHAPRLFSQGLAAAVQCQDAPQVFDMDLNPAERRVNFEAALERRRREAPDTYAPFTIDEYRRMPVDYAFIEQCVAWPARGPAHPPAHQVADSSGFPATPVLVLSGEFDNMTGVADGAAAAAQFPHARHVVLANSFHVNALPRARSACAARLARAFIATLEPGDTRCAGAVPALRLAPEFAITLDAVAPATALPGNQVGPRGLRLAHAALATAGDLLARLAANGSGHGAGLRGGSFRVHEVAGTLEADLSDVRWTADVSVSGRLAWRERADQGWAALTVRDNHGASGSVRIRWPAPPGDRAMIEGRIDGQLLAAWAPAP